MSFDPAAVDVTHVELVENGVVVRRIPRREGLGQIDVQFERVVTETAWQALRVTGAKIGEPIIRPALRSHQPNAAAHTVPVYVSVEGAEPLWAHRRSRDVARARLARREDPEVRLGEDRIEGLAERLARQPFDRVPAELLKPSRASLLSEIETARSLFLQRLTQ